MQSRWIAGNPGTIRPGTRRSAGNSNPEVKAAARGRRGQLDHREMPYRALTGRTDAPGVGQRAGLTARVHALSDDSSGRVRTRGARRRSAAMRATRATLSLAERLGPDERAPSRRTTAAGIQLSPMQGCARAVLIGGVSVMRASIDLNLSTDHARRHRRVDRRCLRESIDVLTGCRTTGRLFAATEANGPVTDPRRIGRTPSAIARARRARGSCLASPTCPCSRSATRASRRARTRDACRSAR